MKPEQKFKAGAISATLWKNELTKNGNNFDYYTVSVERSYKDSNGDWKTTHSLRVNDIPKAVLVLNKCYEFLTMKEQEIEIY